MIKQMESRAEYAYLSQKEETSILIDGFQIEQIDSDNIHRIEGRITPSFSWETSEQFLKDGFGYVALDRERVCAVAFSAAVSSDEIDIGVETHEDYRRKGLAAVLADRMCKHIIEIGKKPVWAHSTSNKGWL
ncbi:GNAT family N-acetyltransferase [Butyrivibrio sp. AC2005]|uniref:GNAT family N-acetyltransferase n=1 Tax=Butyrivibrio sp. AC2005 TaxID=1280672 RepID=UPI00047C6FF8|nr:GNAT family N-acetyltransferase [Butyrivibrio sp. AC2005]